MNRRKLGMIYLVLSGVLFGTSPLTVHIASLLGSNSDTFLVVRCLIATLVIIMIMKITRVPVKMPKEHFFDGVNGSLVNALCAILLTKSYSYMDGGVATTLHFVYPVCVMVTSCLFLKDKVNTVKVFALVLCIGGVALLSGGGTASVLGMVLAIVSGLLYGIYIIYIEHSTIQYCHPFQIVLIFNIIMGIMAFLYSINVGSFDIGGYTLKTYLFCLIPVLAVVVGAQPLFQLGVKYTDSTTGSLLSTTEPITSVILGIMFMKEELTILKLLGCISILTGVCLVVLSERRYQDADS